MRVVLDTNVLLSALISPDGPPDTIYRVWRASRYPKFKSGFQPHRVGAMVNNLQRALVLSQLPSDVEADDPFDAYLLAMAIAGDADYLVTGDYLAELLRRLHAIRT